jgi:hypothetical protein
MYQTPQKELTEEDVLEILRLLKGLVLVSKPLLQAENWGRKRTAKEV